MRWTRMMVASALGQAAREIESRQAFSHPDTWRDSGALALKMTHDDIAPFAIILADNGEIVDEILEAVLVTQDRPITKKQRLARIRDASAQPGCEPEELP